MLANAQAITGDDFLSEIIDPEREKKKDKADHEQGAVMNASANDLSHILRDNAGHGMNGLKECAETFGEIGDCDPVPGAEQHDHGFADDTTEAEQHGGNDTGE